MASQKVTNSMRTKIIQFEQSRYTDTHTHTMDLEMESNPKRKEIELNANINCAALNLELWILFKVIVSNPFEHEQSILSSQGVRTRSTTVILICRCPSSNNLECLS